MIISKVETEEPLFVLEIGFTSDDIEILKSLDINIEAIQVSNFIRIGSPKPVEYHGEIIADTEEQCKLLAEIAHEIESL